MAPQVVGRKQASEFAVQDRAEFWHEVKRIAGKRKSLPGPAGAWTSPGSALVLEPRQREEQHAIASAHGELVILLAHRQRVGNAEAGHLKVERFAAGFRDHNSDANRSAYSLQERPAMLYPPGGCPAWVCCHRWLMVAGQRAC